MKRLIGLAIALLMCVAGPALAQDYPARPIRILVPYAPGGISDIAARIVGAKLTEAWGQQVVIENRPGANGFIAVTDAARAAPDGYTLVMVTTGNVAVNPALFKDVPYDVERDLAPMTATLAQEGAGDISASNWTALLAPKGTPQPDHRQTICEGRRDPQCAGRQDPLRRRRRVHHSIDTGRTRGQD